VTEDWFAKLDNSTSLKATDGTKDNNFRSDQNESSFLLEMNKKTSNNAIDPSIADLDLGMDSPKNTDGLPHNPLIKGLADTEKIEPRPDLVKESDDIKKELRYIEKEKQLMEKMNNIQEEQRKFEEERKQLMDQQRAFEQVKFAERQRLKEEARRLNDQHQMMSKMNKLQNERKTMYEKLERDKRMEEEKKNPKKSSIEDHYLLNIKDIIIEKQIGVGGSAWVYKGTYKQIDVAIKRLKLDSIDFGKAKQEFKREVNTLSKIRHPNLVLFMGVALDEKNL